MPEILIVDDEKDIVETLEYNLKQENFQVAKAYDGINALAAVKKRKPDLILLDLMLPGIDGLNVCRQLKQDSQFANIPIIMLTAKVSEVDRVLGLELGADDYITKPFSMRELVARVRAVLKRSAPKVEQRRKYKFSNLEIDVERHEVKVEGKAVALTAREFSLLLYFVENAGKVLGREKLLDRVWGYAAEVESRTVDVHVRRLRTKLKKAGKHIETLRGVGYKFV